MSTNKGITNSIKVQKKSKKVQIDEKSNKSIYKFLNLIERTNDSDNFRIEYDYSSEKEYLDNHDSNENDKIQEDIEDGEINNSIKDVLLLNNNEKYNKSIIF